MVQGVSVKRHLLLVEDDHMLALVEQRQLEKYGYTVSLANTGESAIEQMKTEHNIDLVLMDINLGKGIDGTEAAEQILANHDVPLMFLSSHTEPEVVERTERITSYGYVVKNSGITVLDAAIKMAFKLFDACHELQVTKNTLEATIKALPEVLFELDSEGYCYQFYAPDGAPSMVQPDHRVGENIFDYLDPQIIEIIKVAMAEADETGFSLSKAFEVEINGEIEWFEKSFSRYYTDLGQKRYMVLRRNITARKRAEQNSWITGEKWRRLFEILPVGVTVIDHNRQLVESNPAFEKILEMPHNELTHYYLKKGTFLKADGSELLVDEFPSYLAMTEQRPVLGAIVGITFEDNSIKWTEVNAIPLPDKRGAVVVTSDITKNRQILLQVTENERRFRSLFQHLDSNFALCELVYDKANNPTNYRFLEINKAYEKTVGKKASEIIGRLGTEVHNHTEKYWMDFIFRVAATGKTETFENYHSGTGRYWEVTCFSAGLGQFAILSRDITERKVSLIKLQKAQDEVNEAQEIAKVGSWSWDPYLNEVHWSRGMHLIFGTNEKDFKGSSQDSIDLFHPDDRAMLRDAASRSLAQKKPQPVDARVLMPDGSIKYVHGEGKIEFDKLGQISRMVGTYQDVTEQKLAKQKIEDLLAQSELLLKESHHRVRNFLSTIQALINLEAEHSRNAVLSQILDGASQRIGNMAQLFTKLYDSHNEGPSDLSQFVPDFLKEVMANFPNAKSVTLKTSIASIEVGAKKLQVLAIILNELITNSMKHAFEPNQRGTISVSARVDKGKIMFEIKDNGRRLFSHNQLETCEGFGSTLVRLLSGQLGSQISYEIKNGFKAQFSFVP